MIGMNKLTESGTYEYSEQNINEYSLSFDGVDDYVELNNLNNTLNNFQIFLLDTLKQMDQILHLNS